MDKIPDVEQNPITRFIKVIDEILGDSRLNFKYLNNIHVIKLKSNSENHLRIQLTTDEMMEAFEKELTLFQTELNKKMDSHPYPLTANEIVIELEWYLDMFKQTRTT